MQRTALITGGSSGIGKETAIIFAKNNYNVSICARNAAMLKNAAAEIGNDIFYQKCDVSKSDEVHNFVSAAIEKFGKIDVLVNNAGIFDIDFLANTSEKMWDDILSINLKGMFLATKEALPIMLKNKHGNIINICSMAGKIAFPMDTAYGASKFGVVGFSRCLAEEVKDNGIKVGIVYPGVVDTRLFDKVEKWKMKGFPPRASFISPSVVAEKIFNLAQNQKNYIEEVDVV